jgi:hypothetical protein
LDILDVAGRKCLSVDVRTAVRTIHVAQLAPGAYTARIKGTNEVRTSTFVKQ